MHGRFPQTCRLFTQAYRLFSHSYKLVTQAYRLFSQAYRLFSQAYRLFSHAYRLFSHANRLFSHSCRLFSHEYRRFPQTYKLSSYVDCSHNGLTVLTKACCIHIGIMQQLEQMQKGIHRSLHDTTAAARLEIFTASVLLQTSLTRTSYLKEDINGMLSEARVTINSRYAKFWNSGPFLSISDIEITNFLFCFINNSFI